MMHKSPTMRAMAVASTEPSADAKSQKLAAKLNLPLVTDTSSYSYILWVALSHIALKIHQRQKTFFIDLLSAPLQYRIKHASIKKEGLARALGLKKHAKPSILDTTGGLLHDSFLLAHLGYEVTVLERSPIIYTLLADALARAWAHYKRYLPIRLINADACSWLPSSGTTFDLIYMDPMFPLKKKNALPRQEMLLLHEVVGHDKDASELLDLALSCARKRVVVKRPRIGGILLNEKHPSFQLKGQSCRFDVYIK